MAIEAYVDGSPVIVANVPGAAPPSAQNSGASYIKGDPGPPGPQGPAGQDGQDGQDGFSPTVTPSSITGGHRLTIVDVDGTSTVDVMDGVDGQDGQDGQDGSDGQDGFSPTITSTSITGGHRLTITDADSTKTVDVMDGQDGQTGPAGQDGQDGTSAGFGTPSATVDSGTGTPGVAITASGPDTAKVFSFAFTNLKGAAGQAGPAGQDGAMGPPGLEVSDTAPTSDVLAWIDTDEDTEILVPEMHTTATPNVLNMGTEYLDAAAVYDRTQGETQEDINTGLQTWTKVSLAAGITRYTNSKIRVCVVVFTNYNIPSAAIGGGGSVGVAPLEPVYIPTSISGTGIGVIGINEYGQITLYAGDLSAYLTGNAFGVAVYPY